VEIQALHHRAVADLMVQLTVEPDNGGSGGLIGCGLSVGQVD
jgi:hypothetical protein